MGQTRGRRGVREEEEEEAAVSLPFPPLYIYI
jgi:hypothetical protein